MYNCNYYLVSFGFLDAFFCLPIFHSRDFIPAKDRKRHRDCRCEKFKFRSAYQRLVWEPENDNLHFRLTAQTDIDVKSTSQRTSLD